VGRRHPEEKSGVGEGSGTAALCSWAPNGARVQLPRGVAAQEKRWVPDVDWGSQRGPRARDRHRQVGPTCQDVQN
jgi:hypothetical protein